MINIVILFLQFLARFFKTRIVRGAKMNPGFSIVILMMIFV